MEDTKTKNSADGYQRDRSSVPSQSADKDKQGRHSKGSKGNHRNPSPRREADRAILNKLRTLEGDIDTLKKWVEDLKKERGELLEVSGSNAEILTKVLGCLESLHFMDEDVSEITVTEILQNEEFDMAEEPNKEVLEDTGTVGKVTAVAVVIVTFALGWLGGSTNTKRKMTKQAMLTQED